MNLPVTRRAQERTLSNDWIEHPWSALPEIFDRSFFEILKRPLGRSEFLAVDVSENSSEVTVKAEVPGMCGNNLSVGYHEGILTIEVKKEESREKKREKPIFVKVINKLFTAKFLLAQI